MRSNVGGLDRSLRWILGVGALIGGLTAPMPKGWRIGLFGFAATQLIIAASQYCPVNQALGIDTTESDIRGATKRAARVAKELAA